MQKQVIKFTNRSLYPNSIFIGNEDANLARRRGIYGRHEISHRN